MTSERRVLQRVVALAAVLPVAAGLYGVLFGQSGLAETRVGVSAGSHYRMRRGCCSGSVCCSGRRCRQSSAGASCFAS